MNPKISVIICTHNPRSDYLRRTLDGVKMQTLAKDQWELLLIDNASEMPLAGLIDLSWHPFAQCIREKELGLTPARLRGIKESRGDLIIFVDDDNVLDSDYLKYCLELEKNWPMLGVWGSGHISGEFETTPHPLTAKWLTGLAIYELGSDAWSSFQQWSEACPYGAGLVIRRAVALYYANLLSTSPLRLMLDRVGKSLSSAGDTDMCFCACDLGLGMARFKRLKIIHLIPKERLTFDYLARLNGGFAYSSEILRATRTRPYEAPRQSPVNILISSFLYYYSFLRNDCLSRKINSAARRGRREAILFLNKYFANEGTSVGKSLRKTIN
jgi:glycosyltransferase involved in cell wall biosynthesis